MQCEYAGSKSLRETRERSSARRATRLSFHIGVCVSSGLGCCSILRPNLIFGPAGLLLGLPLHLLGSACDPILRTQIRLDHADGVPDRVLLQMRASSWSLKLKNNNTLQNWMSFDLHRSSNF
jgi:hypothetical protein